MGRLLSAIVVIGLAAGPAGAATIHRWIDADGVTHFSDSPPESKDIDVEIIEFGDDYSPTPAPDEDYYSITNQWRRLHEERVARQQLNIERARLRAEQAPVPLPQEDDGYQPPRYIAYPYAPQRFDRIGRRGHDFGGFRFDNRGPDRRGGGSARRGVRNDGPHAGGRHNSTRRRFSLGVRTDLD
jgi:hypothetical protein